LSGDAPLEEAEDGGVGWFPGAMLGTIESLNALARFKSRLVEFVKREPARL
jgi:hypothetical protein